MTTPSPDGADLTTRAPDVAAPHTRDERGRCAGGAELPADRFLEREISWLQFNERVLELAADDTTPLLERARFLAIFASNLDEFFMVRVAGLKRRIATGMAVRSASGREPKALLDEIWAGGRELMQAHARLFAEEVAPALAREGIEIVGVDVLGPAEQEALAARFEREVYPVLTPLAVDPVHPFPYISGLSLNLACILVNPVTGSEHFARVKVPPALPRLLRVPSSDGEGVSGERDESARYVTLEDLIAHHLDMLFPGTQVREVAIFRVTRNEDLEVEEDDAENLLTALERELTRRRFGPPVRLEIDEQVSERLLALLVRELRVRPQEAVLLPTPLDLRALHEMADLSRSELRFPPVQPRTHPDLAPVERSAPSNVLATLRSTDILLHHPYDSFATSVQAFLEQAATDPQVLAIKQTLYRTSGNSPIVDALIEAAEAGKQVLAVVEIKARFDEENNITWARKLEQAGVHVVYGIVGLKTHAKIALVVRQESDGLRRYCHIGTGNYNPRTARAYEDFGLLTSDPQVGEDLTRLFNQLSGVAPRSEFSRLLVAPRGVRAGLLERIDAQRELAEQGHPSYIGLKVNALVDERIIDGLYRASQAGVPVDLLVRGMCALRPGVPGLSGTVRVRSVLGRFLEHSRVYAFGDDSAGPQEASEVLIGSADLMHRNLDRRVEALVRILDPAHVAHLRAVLRGGMSEGVASFHLQPDGGWVRHHRGARGEPLADYQMSLVEEYERSREKGQRR